MGSINMHPLNLAMEVVEAGFKIQTTSWFFGMLVTSLRNCMYKITQLQRKDKYGVLQKREEESRVQYVKKI
jgi:hypothetical protein